jgi:hypothetical protein
MIAVQSSALLLRNAASIGHRCVRLYSRLDSRYELLVSAVETNLLRLFLVTACNAARPDKVTDFFKTYGSQLLSSFNANSNSSRNGHNTSGQDAAAAASDWQDWLMLPYLPQPEKEPKLQVCHISLLIATSGVLFVVASAEVLLD